MTPEPRPAAVDSMEPTRQLPAGYSPQRVFSLDRPRVLIALNLAGLVLLVVSGAIFVGLFAALRPTDLEPAFRLQINSLADVALVLLVAVLVTAGMIVLHEAVHGLFFWVFTRSRPVFAFKGTYAYAAAPGWYIPRNEYLVIGLAPLVLISLAGAALLAVAPTGWVLALLALLVFNASGAVGDLWVTLSLLGYPASAYCYDQGDRTTVYTRDLVR